MSFIYPLQRRYSAPILVVITTFAVCPVDGQIAGTNVNMVSGTQWPGGDPFLQRQNEPSMAISSRNPLHMLAGANDYRTVDLPGVSGAAEPTGDAWLGLFKSFDGGQTWTSTLVPGYPQDQSSSGVQSPLKGLGAAADPGVRAGTNGMFYYSGLAFNRQAGGASKIFVAAFIDDNNLEGGDSINYIRTTVVQSSSGNVFEDKPALAVDIPRSNGTPCVIPRVPPKNSQMFPGGSVYVAWTEFTGTGDDAPAQIMFSRSFDCGLNWSNPKQLSDSKTKFNQGATIAIDPTNGNVYVAWRVFATTSPVQADAIEYVASFDGGRSFTNPAVISNIIPFDQGDTGISFRTNAYPSMAVDDAGRIYVAWTQRAASDKTCGGGPTCDARIRLVTGTGNPAPRSPLVQWSAPVIVDPWVVGRGHQIMPALAFSAGKLTVAWYDLRNDDRLAVYTPTGGGQYSSILQLDGAAPFPIFDTFIADPIPPYDANYGCSGCARRQTMDVRAAQASPGNPPAFSPSVQVSQYAFGSMLSDPPNTLRQLQMNPPNLPMFQSGTLPFLGDYIDVAGPTFIANHDGTWRYNNQATDTDYTHVVWTDNRNVVQPADGNWANYTPPTIGTSTTSLFDPTQQRPACTPLTQGNTGDRNQDIYTAQLSTGLVVSARGNAKPLGADSNGQLMQREFPISVQNTTDTVRTYQLNIGAQPAGGAASFLQFPVQNLPFPLTQITLEVPPLSSSSRSIFVTSTDAQATVPVSVTLTAIQGLPVSDGQTGTVTINGDITNPNISNPNISNTEIYNPNISNPNISNPNISNPNISNPNISNPNISNVVIANPDLSNPNISNPNISNPNISNPNISNPNISNTSIGGDALTDTTWTVTNGGNTAVAYSLKMLQNQPIPTGVSVQLIISQSYNTTAAIGCTPIVQQQFVPVANITDVKFVTIDQLTEPAAGHPDVQGISLLPGESAFITIRALGIPAAALQGFNAAVAITPGVVSQAANTGTTTPPIALAILAPALPQATASAAYSQQFNATGGAGNFIWTASGNVPPGLQLSSTGLLFGTPTTAGSYTFTVTVTSGTQSISEQPTIVVNPAPSITTAALSAGDIGFPYSQTVSVTGGTAPLVLSVTGGSLPAGLSLNGSTISGTLSANAATSTFTLTVADANKANASRSFRIVVNPAPAIGTTTLTAGTAGSPYSFQIAASGGTGTLSFTPVANVDGLSLSAAGLLSGIPAKAGSFQFTVTVTDAIGGTASVPFTFSASTAIVPNALTLPAGNQNFRYPAQQLTASGGAGSLSFAVTSAAGLPTGMSLSPAGVISGTPTASGTFPFTVTVTDSNQNTGSQNYSITVNGYVLKEAATFAQPGVFPDPQLGLRLTSDTGQASAIWSSVRQSVANGFTARFQFRLTQIGNGCIADGVALVIQNSPDGTNALGGGGGSIGYTGIASSLAIEFDSFFNGDLGDSNANHIAFLSNGTLANTSDHNTARVRSAQASPAFALANGVTHQAVVTYVSGTSPTLTVTVDGATQLSSVVRDANGPIGLASLLGLPADGTAVVGITSATGACSEFADVSPVVIGAN